MKLVWHIIAKDLRRHQLPYGLWLCLLLAKQAVLVLGFSDWAADAEWFQRLQIGDVVLSVVETVVAFLLVGSWVLEDPVVGSTQFWVTRPLSGTRLLRAKVLGVALLFVAVPLFAVAPGWLACGLAGRELGQQTIIFLSVQIPLVAAAVALGALSDRSSRFLVQLLGGAVAALVLTPLVPKLFTVYPETRALAATRAGVALTVIGVAVIGTIWLQYTRRRAWLGAAWLITGVVLGVPAWNQFPFEFDPGWRRTPKEAAGAQALELTISGVQPDQSTGYQKTQKTPRGRRWIEVVCNVRNLPSHLRLTTAYGRFIFTAADGRRHEAERLLAAAQGGFERDVRAALGVRPFAFAEAETRATIAKKVRAGMQLSLDEIQKRRAEGRLTAAQAEAQLSGIVEDGPEVPTLTARLLVPDWLAAQLMTGTASVDVLADVRFSRLNPRGEFLLTEPGSRRVDGFRARVLDHAIEHRSDRSTLAVTITSSMTGRRTRPHYCVVNREIGYVSPLATKRSREPIPALLFGTVQFGVHDRLPRILRDGRWVAVPEIEKGLVLATLTIDEAGLVRRRAQRDNVPWVVPVQ